MHGIRLSDAAMTAFWRMVLLLRGYCMHEAGSGSQKLLDCKFFPGVPNV